MPNASARALSDFLFLPDNALQADVTIVLGMTLWQRPLARALLLHEKGLAGKLIFTGGYNAKLHMPEAEAMAQEAAAQGLEEDAFLVDNAAQNTRENFLHCKQLMQANGIAPDCKMNIVTIAFHMRRALMTAQDVFEGAPQIGTASYPSIHYASEAWHESIRGRQDIASEMQKLTTYYPADIPPALMAAAQTLGTS